MTKPILRWAGSKRPILPLLQAAMPNRFERYIEPFAGSAALYLSLPPAPAILGDLNKSLVDAYVSLRAFPRAVWREVSAMPTDLDFYYELRAVNERALTKRSRAARFFYLNRFCFNGVYRTNRSGNFNVPRGSGRLHIPSEEDFYAVASHLRHADLVHADFETVLMRAGRGDFVYMDPPYSVTGKRDRGEYGCESFRDHDIDRFIAATLAASRRGAKILISYSRSAALQEILSSRGWFVHDICVHRNVAGFSGLRGKAEELLASNYDWEARSAGCKNA
ncbi:DNA adenine methylase [Paraburkholderia sediminicola]|uniref:DNA adenine methylase n=1 Tax=Paraburkholderia sediminicola TaxID=458836 RepID=UPI0038B8841D